MADIFIHMKYSERPKSEHVRISDSCPLFGSKSCSVLKMSEIRTDCSDFRQLWNRTADRSNVRISDVST